MSKTKGKSLIKLIVLVLLALGAFHPSVAEEKSDSEIKKAIIAQSLANYPGPCPCPYNTMRNGRACGGRSAYSKPGGYSPICYEGDITEDMIESYKARNNTN